MRRLPLMLEVADTYTRTFHLNYLGIAATVIAVVVVGTASLYLGRWFGSSQSSTPVVRSPAELGQHM
jgi:negative regulator of sigma E activity